MKHSLVAKKWAIVVGNSVLNVGGYLIINTYLAGKGEAYDLAVGLDYQIPFIKYFVLFYSIVYFMPLAALFICWRDYPLIKAASKGFAAAALLCFTCFLLFPVKYHLRAELVPPYDFFTNILRIFYSIDQPYNCFPSLHVSLSLFSAIVIHRKSPGLAPFFYLLAALVSLSILFMKQHYVLDLLGGVLVSWLATVAFLPRKERSKEDILEKLPSVSAAMEEV